VSRANLSAYPIQAESNGAALEAQHGLTIREHAYFQIMAAIIASGRPGSSKVLDVAAEAREYVDAGLDELAQEPRK
jgi:hypothetical protein